MYKGIKSKAQTSLILIVLVIIIMMGLGVFFIISSIQTRPTEYNNLYTHNLLISILRKNTGYKTPCYTFSETLACAMLTSYKRCGTMTCREVLDNLLPGLIEDVLKPNLGYYMVIQPENYEIAGGDRITYGNPNVEGNPNKWVANERILQYESNIRVELILSEM
jgi:hypothetical protein